MNNINLELKLVGSIEGEFYVPAYQRGYRWKEEVKTLLNDIEEIEEGKNYSLQPVVVKRIDENKYELIDGQQRLTTLYIIFKYIREFLPKNQLKYSIEYETRKNSRFFLEESIDFKNTDINPNNIDEYFLIEAAKTIAGWFSERNDESQAAIDINTKLNKYIRVIWYEVDSSEDSTSLFTRLNIGRIPLTNAELVKALFLNRNNGIDSRKQLEIATEWDIVEKELHNDNLWYFITNENPKYYPTRIELIFDLMAGKEKGEREKFFTFFQFDKEIKQRKEKSELWTEIMRYFQRLKEWYENNDIYHKIGYLITTDSGNKTIRNLINDSKQVTKTDFQKSLDNKIADSIKSLKEYSELSYESKTDYVLIEKLLLLFNVETIRQKSDESMRFPFDKHKQENWSLEHIHAQQSQGLNKKEQWVGWLNLHRNSLVNIDCNADQDLIKDISAAINDDKLTGERFSSLFNRVTTLLSEEGSIEYTHSLSNLALLGQSDNSALNNATFDVKRNKILEMDRSNDYIPVCTRRVFLKYYTPSESNQVHFWGKADRDGYTAEIEKVLSTYLAIIGKKLTT
jgi:uncharacterized protein with ParB-like and HNH nuclease domain